MSRELDSGAKKKKLLHYFRGGYYYAMYGGGIVAKYRETYIQKYPRNKILLRKEPSFIEFVHYIIGR